MYDHIEVITVDLTQGPIRKQLILFSLPIILTLILQQSYSLIDTMIVSHYCSPTAISAIATTSSLYSFLIALIAGFGVGCSISAGKAYGKKMIFIYQIPFIHCLLAEVFFQLFWQCCVLFLRSAI